MRGAAMAAVDIRGRAGALWVCARSGLPTTGPGEAGPLPSAPGHWGPPPRRAVGPAPPPGAAGARRSRCRRGAERARWCGGRCPGDWRANRMRSEGRPGDWKTRCGRSRAGCGAASLLVLVRGSGATGFVCIWKLCTRGLSIIVG